LTLTQYALPFTRSATSTFLVICVCYRFTKSS